MTTVIKIGSNVLMGCGLDAIVLRVGIAANGVSYEVGYWDGNNWKEMWLPASQVNDTEGTKKTKIGFQ